MTEAFTVAYHLAPIITGVKGFIEESTGLTHVVFICLFATSAFPSLP